MKQVMDFLCKIENFLNALILKIGARIVSLIPLRIRNFFATIDTRWKNLIQFFRSLPVKVKEKLPELKSWAMNYRETVVVPLKEGLAKYNSGRKEKAGQLKVIFLAPFLLFSAWLKGLSSAQALLLMFLSGASVLSGISIISSGARLMQDSGTSRAPASAEEVSYDRPDYYKKNTRHMTITNFRLPVYIPEVNDIRSVDIDFTATLNTRESKMFLEKNEFQLRDHLIHEIEPSVASFPLSDEGKEIIRSKLKAELDHYLKASKVNGHVEDLKVIYILAN